MNPYVKKIVKQKAKIAKKQSELSRLLSGLSGFRSAILGEIEALEQGRLVSLQRAKELHDQRVADAKALYEVTLANAEATHDRTIDSVNSTTDAQKAELSGVLDEHFPTPVNPAPIAPTDASQSS